MYEPTCVLSNIRCYSIHYSCLLHLLCLCDSLCVLLVTLQSDWLQQLVVLCFRKGFGDVLFVVLMACYSELHGFVNEMVLRNFMGFSVLWVCLGIWWICKFNFYHGWKTYLNPFLEMQGCSHSLSCTMYGFKCCWLGEWRSICGVIIDVFWGCLMFMYQPLANNVKVKQIVL